MCSVVLAGWSALSFALNQFFSLERSLPCALNLLFSPVRSSHRALIPSLLLERSSRRALSLSLLQKRNSPCALLQYLKPKHSTLWALNLLKSERSSPRALNPSRKLERRYCARISRRQPGGILPCQQPTGTRKIQARCSSCRAARDFARRQATKSRDLLPISSGTCECERALCTTGVNFSWRRLAQKKLR